MPWCDDCSKYWTYSSLPADGTCPTCGRLIGEPPSTGVPWHFWVLIIGTAVYLGYRAFQGFEWLVNNDHTVIAVVLGIVLAVLIAAGVRWWFSRDEDAEPPAAGPGPGPDAQPTSGV